MAQMSSYEVPTQIRDLAETSVEQARKAFGSFIGAARRASETAHDTADLARTNAQALYARSLDHAEQNIRAALDHAQKLAAAGSLPEAAAIQAEYARERFAALQAQAQDVGSLAQSAFQQGAERARAALQQGADAARTTLEQWQDAARDAAAAAHEASGAASH